MTYNERFADGAVLARREPGILYLQLDRPQKRNALNGAMIDALATLVAETTERVIVLSGSPGFFCAGADIAAYRDADAAALADFTARARGLCRALTVSPAVVIAAVDGLAMGGGLEIVLSADVVVASAGSRFGLPEIKLGLIPGWGGTQRLVRFLGPNRTKEAILFGEVFDVQEAHAAGLVNRVVEPGLLDETAAELARSLAVQAPLALRSAKHAVTAAYDPNGGLDDASELETRLLLELFASPDGVEGVSAFVEKRPPAFTAP